MKCIPTFPIKDFMIATTSTKNKSSTSANTSNPPKTKIHQHTVVSNQTDQKSLLFGIKRNYQKEKRQVALSKSNYKISGGMELNKLVSLWFIHYIGKVNFKDGLNENL